MSMAFMKSGLLPVEVVHTLDGTPGRPGERNARSRSARALARRCFGQQRDRFAVAVQRADVDVGRAGLDPDGLAAPGEIRVDQRADELVLPIAREPEILQLAQGAAGHLEGAPDPARGRVLTLDLDLAYAVVPVELDRVEVLRVLDGEEQERQAIVRQGCERVLGEPHGVGKADHHGLVLADERRRAEDRVAQATRLLLHHVGDVRAAVGAAIIFEDVGLSRRDDEADLVGSSPQHALHEVLADGAGPLDAAVEAAADGQELLREGERLDSASPSGGWNDAPHGQASKASRTGRGSGGRASARASSSAAARLSDVCSATARSRPAAAMRMSSAFERSSAATASSVVRATSISSPGTKKASKPSHQSDRIAVPHAAASNRRPDGHQPMSAMARRVMLSVTRDEEKNAGCSGGGRWRTKKMLSVQGKPCGYCAPPMRNRRSGRRRAGSMNRASSAAWRSAA